MTRKVEKVTGSRRGLGRGLDALFGDEEGIYKPANSMDNAKAADEDRTMMSVARLEPGLYQPRQHFDADALEQLAQSIREHGILQPLLVRPKGPEGSYEIIAGERRWRAAQKARLHEVPVIIRELDDRQTLEIALIENLQRKDLTPMEEADGYKRLMDEFDHTQDALAAIVGKSRPHIANMLRLLGLPESVRKMVNEEQLSAGHARALLSLQTKGEIESMARRILREDLSVRAVEQMVKGMEKPVPKKTKPAKGIDTLALEEELGNILGLPVDINAGKTGKGKLTISYATLDQLEDVLDRLSVAPQS